MSVNLSISRLVNFGLVITPAGVIAPQLNTGLVLGTSNVIDTVQNFRTYDSLEAVGLDFGAQTEEYLSAQAWFGQKPTPNSLNIGRWVKNAAAGVLVGGPVSAADQLASAWTGITTGSFKIQVDTAVATNVTGLNFGAVTNMNAVAAVIQAGIQGLGGQFAAVTCAWNANYQRFQITSGTTGAASVVDFLTPAGTGVDISGMLEMTSTSSGAYEAPGEAAQSALAAVEQYDSQYGGQWYHLFVPSAADADALAISPYVDGDVIPHFFWYNSQDAGMLNANYTAGIGYLEQQLQSQHTGIQYSSTSKYAAFSMAARIATVNWSGSNTAISLMYKTEPGIAAENLNDTQIGNLEGYNVNVFVTYSSGSPTSGTPIIEPGICPSGQFIDTIVGSDGLRGQIGVNVFNILLAQQAKIPQTDAGVTTLETGVQSACDQYVTNGFLAPGIWNAGGFGTLTEGQFLDMGYYVYGQPINQQSEAQRAQRICPPIQVAAKLAGAIDTVSGTVYVNA